MMNLKKNFFAIIGMVLVFTCDAAHAQKIEAQQLEEFMTEQGGSLAAYVDKISKEGKATVIPCGTYECDPKTQKCIACTFKDKGWTQIFTLEKNTVHYCVDKSIDPSTYNLQYRSIALTKNEYTCREVSAGVVDKHTLLGITISKTDNCKYDESNKKKYCFNIKGDNQEVVLEYANDETSMKGCEVLPVKLYNMRKCFFCPLFSVIFAASEKMPSISFSKLATAFATLIALGLAIWIAFQTLTHVSSLTKQDAPKFLGNLIKQSYKFLIAFLLLQNGSQIFEYAINPVLNAGINFGGQFLENNVPSEKVERGINDEINERAKKVTAYGFYISEDTAEQARDKELYRALDGYVSSIQREIAFMQAVGSSLICTGNHAMFTSTEVETFASGFKMILQGLVFAIFGFLLSIAFAFYIVDAVVQLGIVGALMPFLIASWPFKVTAQYAGTGFKMLLNSAFIFVFIGLTVEVNMQLINAALTNNVGGKQEIKASATDDVSFGALHDIAIAINEQNSTKLVELTDISTIGFLILIFCCIFGFKFMGQTSALAGQFSSGGIKPTAPSIATMGGSAALSATKKVTQPVREAVGRKAEDLGMRALSAAAHPVRTGKAIGRSVRNVFSSKKGGGSGDGGSEGGNTEERRESASSGTTENSTPVVGQNGGKTGNAQSGNGPRVGQKSTVGGGAAGNQGGAAAGSQGQENSENTTAAPASETGGETVQPAQATAPATASRKQRKYSHRKKNENRRRIKQRRNYGRRHK